MQTHEGSQQFRQRRPAIDLCKVDRLKKLARETEILAMELVCEVYGTMSGSGHQEPPVPGDGEGMTNVSLRRHSNGHPAHPNPPAPREAADGEVSTHGGSGHQEPPVPIVDALVSVAHGAREICEGCDTLS
jgi:hypothetical protein